MVESGRAKLARLFSALTSHLILFSFCYLVLAANASSNDPEEKPGKIELLKVDPNPVGTNIAFSIVLRLTNKRTTPLRIAVDANTNKLFGHNLYELAGGEIRVIELSGIFATAGTHIVTVVATWQNDKVFQPLAEQTEHVDLVVVLAGGKRQ